jgi:hypothetical protein
MESEMKSHSFTIVASGLNPDANDYADRFFEAGCDDATVALQKGSFILDFDRRAESFEAALASALDDVKRAGAIAERVEPDHLVNASDIAARGGMTRAAISNYSAGKRAVGFPAPIARVTTDSPLWDWVDVAKWLAREGKVSDQAVAEALAIRNANAAIDRMHRVELKRA